MKQKGKKPNECQFFGAKVFREKNNSRPHHKTHNKDFENKYIFICL
jgi:hypothetical protein